MKSISLMFIAGLMTSSAHAKVCSNCRHAVDPTTGSNVREFSSANIEPALSAMQLGNATILDPDCSSHLYSTNNDALVASVNGQSYYVVFGQVSLNGKTYGLSYCQRTALSNNVINVECISQETSPAPQASSLSFEMEYVQSVHNPSHFTIHKCPQMSE